MTAIFSRLYLRVLNWSKHPHAVYYLFIVSFTESSFFPIPPDVILAPMAMAEPKKAWWYAFLTTLASTLGALGGYLIGMFGFFLIHPILMKLGYMAAYEEAQQLFIHWGAWILFLAAFTPIPFKLFTVAGGALHMALIPFIIGSTIGRGLRFFLVAALMRFGGKHIDKYLRRFVDWIGWATLILALIALALYYFFKS